MQDTSSLSHYMSPERLCDGMVIKCPNCNGKKYIEHVAGLIQTRCSFCKGKGEIEYRADTGDNGDNPGVGSEAPRQPRKKRKQKAG